MRRLVITLVGAVLLAGCSYSTPRYPAVYSPTEPSTAPPAASSDPAGSSPAAPVDTSAWITLAPRGAGFSVLMPSQPQAAEATIDTPGGKAKTYNWGYADSSDRAFAVTVAVFAGGALSGSPAKTILDETTTTVAANWPGARISSQADVTLSGHAGRVFTLGNSTTTVQCEFFIAGDAIFGISLSYPAGQSDGGLAQAFFASFQLTV